MTEYGKYTVLIKIRKNICAQRKVWRCFDLTPLQLGVQKENYTEVIQVYFLYFVLRTHILLIIHKLINLMLGPDF